MKTTLSTTNGQKEVICNVNRERLSLMLEDVMGINRRSYDAVVEINECSGILVLFFKSNLSTGFTELKVEAKIEDMPVLEEYCRIQMRSECV
jgi:hypothetical protein